MSLIIWVVYRISSTSHNNDNLDKFFWFLIHKVLFTSVGIFLNIILWQVNFPEGSLYIFLMFPGKLLSWSGEITIIQSISQ